MAKHLLKVSSGDCAVKISGPGGTSETIDLSVDLLAPYEELTPDYDQVVDITGLTWTGDVSAVIQIKRNDVIIATLQSQTTSQYDFKGQGMVPDNVENTSDLVVTITNAQAEVWIRLQKKSGYSSKVEQVLFGQYDDPTKIGE